MIVTVKQVPDTHNISGEAMKPDGTVNRAALPAVFNPEDLNALELALDLRERLGGSVIALTMGPPAATAILRECLYRGADDAILLSDRAFAGSDTLATSLVLAGAIATVERFDLVVCGRQAIDGDTAQVGPQIAEKLAINQITCVSGIEAASDDTLTVKRSVENGYQVVESGFPLLLTVTAEANFPRFANARRVMKYKGIRTQEGKGPFPAEKERDGIRHMRAWNAATVGISPDRCGIKGSPTKVKRVESVVLTEQETLRIPESEKGVRDLIRKLIRENIIG